MEKDTNDSTVQGQITEKCVEKNKIKDVQKKILIDTECENNINTVAE